jgi:hypothetical protein
MFIRVIVRLITFGAITAAPQESFHAIDDVKVVAVFI